MAHTHSVKWHKDRSEFVAEQSNEFFAGWLEGKLTEWVPDAVHDFREIAKRLRTCDCEAGA